MILENLIIPISQILIDNFEKNDTVTTIELDTEEYFRAERDLMETWFEWKISYFPQPKIDRGKIEFEFNGLTFIIKRKNQQLIRHDIINRPKFF